MTEDEKFFAWLDGELGPAEAAEMKAKVAADRGLTRLAEQHRAFGDRLHAAFDPIAVEPAPDSMQAALSSSGKVIDFAAAKRARGVPSFSQWAAMAATLAFGMLIGTMIPQRGDSPVVAQGGKLYAAASLDRALDTQLASAPVGDVRIGLTFRDQAGEICRSFTQGASSGLACRDGARWRLRGLFGVPEGRGSDYRMAAGMDPNLAALVDPSLSGEPFDAAQEQASKARGWK